MRQNTVFLTKNTKKISGEGAQPPPQIPPQWRGGHPSHTPHPRIDPLHAEILGTPLVFLARLYFIPSCVVKYITGVRSLR